MTMPCPRCWGAGGPCDGCEGKRRVPDVQLSPAFTLSEMLRSDTARVRGIANAPTSIHVRRLRELATQLLQPMRDALGPLVMTSGLRVERLNTAVGGSPTSAHVVGWAADVQPLTATLDETMAWLAGSRLSWDQIIREPGWIHVGLRRPGSGEQRQQMLRYEGGGSYLPWFVPSISPPALAADHGCTRR